MPDQPTPKLLVPRAVDQGEAFARDLEAAHPGLVVPVIAPLIRIEWLSPDLSFEDWDALIFTSANGVSAFSALSPERHLPACVVGERTAIAAREAGFDVAEQTDTVDRLKTLLTPGTRYLYLRGRHVSRDLSALPGLDIRDAIIYEAAPVPLNHEVAVDLISGEISGVCLFSPRMARRLAEELGGRQLPAATRVLCLSPRVALAAEGLGGGPLIAAAPHARGLIALIGASFRR